MNQRLRKYASHTSEMTLIVVLCAYVCVQSAYPCWALLESPSSPTDQQRCHASAQDSWDAKPVQEACPGALPYLQSPVSTAAHLYRFYQPTEQRARSTRYASERSLFMWLISSLCIWLTCLFDLKCPFFLFFFVFVYSNKLYFIYRAVHKSTVTLIAIWRAKIMLSLKKNSNIFFLVFENLKLFKKHFLFKITPK